MFDQILDQFKEKKHDLLDYNTNKFDRDFVEFNVRVGELETSLQHFINRSFESISSIEASLAPEEVPANPASRDSEPT